MNIIQLTNRAFIVSQNLCIFTKNITMNLTQEDWVSQFETDENAVILDVRTEAEFNEGIIANAINIDIHLGQGFISEIEALDKTKNYYVYCRSGMRSAKACEIMNELGFENAYNLVGGIIEWDGEVVAP
jgi:rhodanese-related sulfurtransferase